MNPFRSAFAEVFIRERDAAAERLGGKADEEGEAAVASEHDGGRNGAEAWDEDGREQLVWVLWKILKGDGIDVGCLRKLMD